MATTNFSFATPTVGGSEDTWGADLNANWTALDGILYGSSTIRPDLATGLWKVGGVAVTATAAQLNYSAGLTGNIQTQLSGKQALDDGLTSIAGLTTAADRMIYTTALDTYAVTSLTGFARTMLDDADASTVRGTLGVGDGFIATAGSAGSDLNNVDESGSYLANGATASNIPGAAEIHTLWHSEISSSLASQLAIDLSTNYVYSRRKAGGAWGAWAALSPAARQYESAEQTITSSGSLTLAHGLGAMPQFFTFILKCKVAEFNYSVGDELLIPPGNDANTGISVVSDSTNINIRYGLNGTVFSANNKTGGAGVSLTNTSWRLIVRARL
jgi:hypothetical protein